MAYRFQQVVEPRAGEFIGRGIASMGEAMGRGIVGMASAQKQEADNAKFLDGFKKAAENDPTGQLQQLLGGKDPYEIGVSGVKGLMEGAMQAERLRGVQEERDQAARMREAMGMTRGEGPTVPMAEAMGRAGVTDPRMIQAGLSLHEAMEGTSDVAGGFIEDPVTGRRFVRHGRQILPAGQNPSMKEVMEDVRFYVAPDQSIVAVGPDRNMLHLRKPSSGNIWDALGNPSGSTEAGAVPSVIDFNDLK